MKLRLPHKFQAALLAAIASVSFTTLSSGTLGAAFFLGNQAFADEAADEPTAIIDLGDTNLDDQAAMEDEEGDTEDSDSEEVDLSKIKVQEVGFNGLRGSSDDADCNLESSVSGDIADAATPVAAENAGSPVQAAYSPAAALPADDLGFTSNPYAAGTESGVSSPVFTEAAAPAVQPVQAVQTSTQVTTTPSTSSSSTGSSALGSFSSYSASPYLGLSSSSLGSTTPAISTPLATGLSVDTGSSSSGTPALATLGAAETIGNTMTTTFSNANETATSVTTTSTIDSQGELKTPSAAVTRLTQYTSDSDVSLHTGGAAGRDSSFLSPNNNVGNAQGWKLTLTYSGADDIQSITGMTLSVGLFDSKGDWQTPAAVWNDGNETFTATVTANGKSVDYTGVLFGDGVDHKGKGDEKFAVTLTGVELDLSSATNFTVTIAAPNNTMHGGCFMGLQNIGFDITTTSPEPPEPAEGTNIGKWMAIGDSITHGTNSSSYRWALQKIFTDNGISFDAEGYKTGCYTGGYDNLSYGGADFDNQHSAQFNIWTDEIAGTDFHRNTSVSGLQSTNIKNWLGLSTILTPTTRGGTGVDGYTGPTFAPDTYTIMLGTNDLNGMSETTMATIFANDAVIVGAVDDNARNNNKTATLYMMSVTATNKSAALANNIASYNAQLQSWVSEHKSEYANTKLIYVDINAGLQDVTKTSGWGVASMYAGDALHPLDQASLIIAGNLARGMGYAGRTAGQFRKAAGAFAQHDYAGGFSALPATGLTNVTLNGTALDFSAGGASTATFNWDTTPTGGYTVDFSLLLGNGSTDGWDTTTNFSMSLGNGTLNVNEAYIKWGDTILYSRNASTAANLRVAYVQGDAANNLAAGYYVWLGDQLIGEACAAGGSVGNAVTFSYSGSGNALLKSLAMDSTGSWAPTTNLTEGDDGYHANPFVDDFRISTRRGEGDFSQANVGATQQALTDGIISGKRKGGDYYYANYSGDSGNLGNCHVWSFEKANAGGSNLHYVTYGLGSGSTAVTARLAGANMNFHTVHGLYNGSAASMSADVLTQLDSVGGTFGAYHGSEKMSSTGKVALTMNEGTISGDVVGGFAAVANDSQSIASTEININYHGVVGGNVYGGSTANGTVTNARVAITGGRIGGSVYGGGTAGTVGTATVEITGGEITGNVYGGAATGGTVTNPTSVAVKTYVPYIHGDIEADNVTISDLRVAPDTDQHGFDKYAGTITADTITLDNANTFSADAKLVTQTLNVRNKSSVTIHGLTLTACEVNVDDSSSLTLADSLVLGNNATYTGTLNLANNLTIDVSALNFGDMTTDVALLTTTSGNLGSTNVNNITLDFGESQEPSYYNLVRSGENLMLTFEDPSANALIWNGGTGTWNKQDSSWHKKDSATDIVFTDGSDVRFDSASNNCTVTVGEVVQANSMTIDKDVAVTIDSGNNLTTTLKGEGTYVLPGGQKALPSSVTLDSAEWTGAVQMSGTDLTELRFVTKAASAQYGLATENSVIELKGVSGWMRTEAQLNNEDHIGTAHNANIRLVNADSTPALKITNGGSNSTTTLSGKISGNGTFEHNWGGGACTFKLTGDLSEWTGDFNKTGGNTTTLALTDNASTIAPDIKNTGNGTLNVNINNANAVTLTGDISKTSGTLNLNVGNEKATSATFEGAVTASALAVNGTSTAAFAGGTGNLGNITLTGNNNGSTATTLRFSPGAGSGTGSYTASTIDMSSQNNAGLKWVVVDKDATLELTGTNLGSGGGASISNSWGVSSGGLEVNGTLTTAGTISMDSGGNQSTIKGSGQINTAGLNISNSNTTTINGGVKINITSSTGIYKRAGSSTLNLADATLQAKDADWELKSNMGTVNLTNAATGTTFQADSGHTITVSHTMDGAGKLVKTGDGTLTLNTANTYAGGTDVNAGTLVVGADGALGSGTTTVNNGGTLELSSLVSSVSGNMTVNEGGTLKLAQYGDDHAFTASTGLTLASGSILDLSSLTGITGTEADPITLVKGGTITATDLGGVVLNFSDQSLKDRASLSMSGNNLVLTFAPLGKDLIWDNAAGTNSWTADTNWHADGTTEPHIAFTDGDNVRFTNTPANPSPTLGADVNAGTMVIDNGVAVTVNTNNHSLTVADFDTAGGSLTKSGAGTATFGGSDQEGVTLSNLTVSEGTATFNEKVTVQGTFIMSEDSGKNPVVYLNGDGNNLQTVKPQYGELHVRGNTTINSMDIGQGGLSYAEIIVENYATLDLSNGFFQKNSTITLKEDAVVKLPGNVNVKALTSDGSSTITRLNTTGGAYASTESNIALSNIAVTTRGDATIGNKLVNSTLTVTDHTVTVNNGANTLTATTVTGGTLNVGAQNALGSGAVSVTGGTLNLGNFAHTNMDNLTVSNGGVVTTTHSDSNGSVKGTININGGGTFAVNGQNDAFGWGTSATSKIVMEGESGEGNMASLALKASGASTTMATDLEMKGYSQITGAAGFNTFGGNITVSGTENTIDAMLVRSAVEVDAGTGAELTVNSLTQHAEGSGALTKTGDGTLILTGATIGNTSTVVNEGTLALTSTVDTITGNLSVAGGATLKLNEMGGSAVSITGTLGLDSGSTLDLSALSISGTEADPITLVQGGTITSDHLNSVIVNFGTQITQEYTLGVQNGNLVLTFAQPEPTEYLVWQGGPGTWDTDADNKSWYPNEETTTSKVAFEDGKSVAFMVAGDSPVTIGEKQITAGNVRIDKGVNVTLESEGSQLVADKITVDGDLTVTNVAIQATSMEINEDAHATANVEGNRTGALATNVSGAGDVTKQGTGSLALTGNNSGFTGTLTIEEGNVIAASSNALGNTPDVVLAGGNLLGKEGVTVTPSGDINITATADATVSANLQVAEGAVLTFNTGAETMVTASGVISGAGNIAKDGTGTLVLDADNAYEGVLNINQGTVLVSNAGGLGGSGTQNVTVHTGSNLAFAAPAEGETASYTADYITLDRGATLTFAGENMLNVTTLDLTAASAVDLSNISLDRIGTYVLAQVDDLSHVESGIVKGGVVQFITMTGIHGDALTPDSLVSLHYDGTYLTLQLNGPDTGRSRYWYASDDPNAVGTWDTTTDNWSSSSAMKDNKTFVNEQYSTVTGGRPYSVYFMDAGTDGAEHITLDENMGNVFIRDMIVAGGEYYFSAGDQDIKMDTNRISNFVVRTGAKANFDGISIQSGDFDVTHICADAKATMKNLWYAEVSSVNNEGEFDIALGGENYPMITSGIGHIDNYGKMSAVIDGAGNYFMSSYLLGEVVNREGATLSIAAPSITRSGTYGDGVIHNFGDLVLDGTTYTVIPQIDNTLQIEGTGVLKTLGSSVTIIQEGSVNQSGMVLGAKVTEFTNVVTITDTTTVKAGATATFTGGGSLGDVALEEADGDLVAVMTFGAPEGETMSYEADTVIAGADSVFEVMNDAAVIIASYNAGGAAEGTIMVGSGEGSTPAHLVVNGAANADSLYMMDGTADLKGYATVSTLTQLGGTANFNAGGYVNGGTVSGGTLDIGDGKVLTLGSAISVTKGGSYTVDSTTGSINADALTLEENMGNADYLEARSGDKTASHSGFLEGGQQYVKVFDLAEEGATLTAANVTVTHRDAAAPLTIQTTGDFAGYGYLDTTAPAYSTYYVRDNYVTGSPSGREADFVKLSHVIEASKGEGQTAQLETVVFDKTDYNKDAAVQGSITVDVQGQHADLFDARTGSVGVVNIGNDADGDRVLLCCCEDYAGVKGEMKIAGTGIYQIENRGTLGENVSLLYPDTAGIAHWTGTVKLIGSAEGVDTDPLSVGSGAGASEIEFDQWTGSFQDTEMEQMQSDAKILLTGTGVVGTSAITLTEGNANLLWTNTVRGEGARIDHAQDGDFTLMMTGDTSQWNGTFTQSAADTAVSLGFMDNVSESGVQSADVLDSAGGMFVEYGGNVKTVNGNATVYGTGEMSLLYTGSGMQVNSSISKYLGQGTMEVTVGDGTDAASATFNGNITADTLTVEAGSDATLDNTTDISGLIDVTAENAKLHVAGTTTAQTVKVAEGASISIQSGTENPADTAVVTSNNGTGNAVLDGGIKLQNAGDRAVISSSTPGELSTVSNAAISIAESMNAASLQLQDLVISADSQVTGKADSEVVIAGTVEQVMGTLNTGNEQSGAMGATALTLTGTTGQTSEPVGDRLYSLDFSGMSTMASLSGNSATLLLDFTQMYTPDAWADMIRDIDYLGVNFNAAIEELNVGALQVQARGYDANGDVATYIGYYVNDGTNPGAAVGQVVYFQVPEPASGTLSLLALAALAARRRRK